MSTTWRSVLLAIAAVLVIVAVALFLLFRFVLPEMSPEPPATEPRFVIADWEGQVAVFVGGESYPMQIYDTDIRALPPEEQEKLRRGIPAEDEAGLAVLLEDYTS